MSEVIDRVDLFELVARSDADRRLLRALRCNPSCRGLYVALVFLEKALEEYVADSALARAKLWLGVCQTMIDRCEALIDAGHVDLGLRAPGDNTPVFSVLVNPPQGGLDDDAHRRSRIQMAVMILAACSRSEAADGAAVEGWATQQRFSARRSGIPEDWRKTVTSIPITIKELEAALTTALTPGLQNLLAGVLTAIKRPLSEPDTAQAPTPSASAPSVASEDEAEIDTEKSGADEDSEGENDEIGRARGRNKKRGPRDDRFAKSNPVGWIIKSDNYSLHSQRFDLIGDRDRLHPKANQSVWSSLNKTFRAGAIQDQARVVFAHISQRSALPARIAIALPLGGTQSTRIEVADGSVVWYYGAAIDTAPEEEAHQIEPHCDAYCIRLALDEDMAHFLRLCLLERPEAATVGELLGIDTSAESRTSWLRSYRAFLREHGDAQHPPYDARFSCSGADVYRYIGANEVLAMFNALDFASIPLGMLHYLTLPATALNEADRRAFEFMGWKWPKNRPVEDPSPKGSAIWISPEDLRRGWARLQSNTDSALADLRSEKQVPGLVSAFNRLAVCRLVAFITLVGHRGTKLSRLTRRALFGFKSVLHLHDKEVGDYQSDRGVPAHRLVDRLLAAWQDDIALLHRRARDLKVNMSATGRRALDGDRPTDPAFFCIRLAPEAEDHLLERTLVWRKALTAEALLCFDRPLNIGRHFLVSQLLLRRVSAWHVRVLTGHYRKFAEAFSDGMHLPPAHSLSVLETELDRLFTDLALVPVTGAAENQAARQLLPPTGAMPDPATDSYLNVRLANVWRVLPAPFDEHMTTALNAIDHLRSAYCDVIDADGKGASTEFTGSQTIFGLLDPNDQEIVFENLPHSIVQVGEVAQMVWTRPDCAQEIGMRLNDRSVMALRRVDMSAPGTWRVSAMAFAHWARTRLPNLAWPEDDFDAYLALAALALRYRRFHFAPTSLTAASLSVPAATFSRRSMLRIASARRDVSDIACLGRAIRHGPTRTTTESEGPLFDLTKALRDVSHISLPNGQERQRARDWEAALINVDLKDDLRAVAWKSVQDEEIRLLISGDDDKDETSTLAGHTSEVLIALQQLGPWDDLRTMDAGQIRDFAMAATKAIDREKKDTQVVRNNETRWFGLKRFLRIGQRLGWRVPRGLFGKSGPKFSFEGMRKSAASTAVLLEDYPVMRRLLEDHFDVWPVYKKRSVLALVLHRDHPFRSTEQIVLPLYCLVTSSGVLLVENDVFSHLKSLHAYRGMSSREELIDLLKEAALDPSKPSTKYLFISNDGRDWSMARAIDEALVSAAAQVTGEANVRKHSFRASAVCRLLWPAWESMARGLLDGSWSPSRCSQHLVEDWQRGYAAAVLAARTAGHGLPLVTLAYYAAAWPLVFGTQVQAGLGSHKPSGALMKQVLGSTGTIRNLRLKHAAEGKDFDVWGAVARLCVKAMKLPRLVAAEDEAVLVQRPDDLDTVEPPREARVLFLAQVLAGADEELAANNLGIPDPYSKRLLAQLPDDETRIAITRRRHGKATPSNQEDDRIFMSSTLGETLIETLLAAGRQQVDALLAQISPHRLNPRDPPPAAAALLRQIRSILACLPATVGLQVRFSEKYAPILNAEHLMQFGDRVVTGEPNPRIGRHPQFQVIEVNHPRDAERTGRITVATRMVCESIVIADSGI